MPKTYEMLWDCEYCGRTQLLGKTHRFCPGCGAPQNPARRYFPPEDRKVAVEDHEYVGADRMCGACGSAMSARAAHCTQCGSAMEGAPDASRFALALPEAPQPEASRGSRRGCLWLLGGVGLALLASLLLAVFWRKDVEARAVARSWERLIHVESYGPVQDSAWCDQMPAGAYSVSRHRDVRSHRQVEDGQDCGTERIDNGDGTYREEERCTTRYRDEPVYDDRCRFTIDRWSRARSVSASGSGPQSTPAWPAVARRGGTCRGCEREVSREESYKVHFELNGGKPFECRFDQARWGAIPEGSRWRVKVGVLTGGASCSSLAPLRPGPRPSPG